jgi:flagellar assembly factor FliW
MTALAVTSEKSARIAIDSLVLGHVEVAPESVFTFANGLRGFEMQTQFALIPAARESLFWLQSTSDRDIVFLLIDPFVASPGFEVDLALTERTALGLDSSADVLCLAIVTLPAGNAAAATANLRGPVVLNTRKQLAQQIMSAVPGHEIRTPIDLNDLPARANY